MKLLKLIVFISVAGLLASLTSAPAKAQTGNDNRGNFGIGVMIGEPTGISVKSWNSSRTAFDIGAAWSLTGREEALHLHSDFLWHSWFSNAEDLAFYYGIGARVIFADEPTAGARFPLGLNFIFQTIPFDLFVEAVPIIDLTPDVELAGNGAVGLRYYF